MKTTLPIGQNFFQNWSVTCVQYVRRRKVYQSRTIEILAELLKKRISV